MKWIYDRWPSQKYEKNRTELLLLVSYNDHLPTCCIGWLRYAAGEKDCPKFIIPEIENHSYIYGNNCKFL